MPGWHISSGAGGGGAGDVVGPSSSTDLALVRWDGATGKLLQDGVITSADFNGDLGGPVTNTATSGVGTAFTNQPANDGVTVVSDAAGDTTQTVTIIGNTNGGDVISTEAIALNGVVPVNSVKVNWGQILAVKLSAACVGTVTIKETSGGLTITTIAPAATSAGVFASSLSAFNRIISFSSNGATVKHAGIKGTDSAAATIYEGATLNGTTLVPGATPFVTVTELYIGDLEAARTLTITTVGGTKLNSRYIVTGPTTAVTDNAIARWDGTTFQVQNSDLVVGDLAANVVDLAASSGNVVSLKTKREWEDSTVGSGAPNVLTLDESWKVIGNAGAGATAYNTLPSAVAGLTFTFANSSQAQLIRITAAAGDNFRFEDQVSDTAGYLESVTANSVVELVAIDATTWLVYWARGQWKMLQSAVAKELNITLPASSTTVGGLRVGTGAYTGLGVAQASNGMFCFASGTVPSGFNTNTIDLALVRDAAGILRLRNAYASGLGSLTHLGNGVLLGKLTNADFNSVNDQSITIQAVTYIVDRIVVTDASINLTTAAGGIYTGAAKTGVVFVAAAQVYTALTAAAKWLNLTLDATAGGPTTDIQTATTVYLSLTVAQGAAATADVYIFGTRLS